MDLPGIEITLDNMPHNGVILLVTDAGTHQRDLEESIIEKSEEKNIQIFIAFYPRCRSKRFCSESMPSYVSVSEGRIFNQSDFDNENFFKSVLNMVRNIYNLLASQSDAHRIAPHRYFHPIPSIHTHL